MAKTIYSKVIDILDDIVRNSKNPEMELKFLDPMYIMADLELEAEDYPRVMHMIEIMINRLHKDNCHYHNNFTDIKHWDGQPLSCGGGKWKYIEHHKSATAKNESKSYFNNCLPSGYWDFEIGDKYTPGDGSFSLWLDAPTIDESKYFTENTERDAEFVVVSKPYWCLRTEKYLADPTYAINMVDVRSLKTGRTYRFINAEYDWDRFSSKFLDRKIETYDWEDDYCDF